MSEAYDGNSAYADEDAVTSKAKQQCSDEVGTAQQEERRAANIKALEENRHVLHMLQRHLTIRGTLTMSCEATDNRHFDKKELQMCACFCCSLAIKRSSMLPALYNVSDDAVCLRKPFKSPHPTASGVSQVCTLVWQHLNYSGCGVLCMRLGMDSVSLLIDLQALRKTVLSRRAVVPWGCKAPLAPPKPAVIELPQQIQEVPFLSSLA